MHRLLRRQHSRPPLDDLRNEMNRLISEYPTQKQPVRDEYPPVNIYQGPDGVAISALLPDVDADDIDLSVNRNTLTLSGERTPDVSADGRRTHRSERRFGKFSRTMQLPFEADPGKTFASFQKGILTIKLAPPEEEKSAKIKIQSAQ